MHVDLDAFFAAVEEKNHPEYVGKPIIVGADPKQGKGRGVVSTCNYVAREFGVRSAMPISRAWRLCPHGVYLPVNYELYEQVSTRIMSILRKYADRFEQVGIDEAFLEISQKASSFEEAERIAREIKSAIRDSEGLTCSVGIGPNKLVAKIASDYRKPDGLTVVREDSMKHFLHPLSVEKIWGIGKKTKERLNSMGIRTIGDLSSCDVARLRKQFGSLGEEFHRMSQGIDESDVLEESPPKSFSREHTFQEDTSDKSQIQSTINDLCTDVASQVSRNGFLFRTVTIKIRYEDFETHTRSRTLPFATSNPESLKVTAARLFDPFLPENKRIRLLGVRASSLTKKTKQRILEI
ncbi:DNA polymerase IV [Candidatus Bathyarchaeota archaeon]|nr:DNA polymerase IV [Candidatus Bathyarchaeota archaeon]